MAQRRTVNDNAADMLHAIGRRGSEGQTLRDWMDRWIAGSRDFQQCPDLMSELNVELQYCRRQILPASPGELNLRELPPEWLGKYLEWDDPQVPMSAGKPVFVHFSTRGVRPLFARRFVDFVLGPDADRLRRCARPSCTEYFVRTGKRTTYCSDECGRSASAQASMRARREKDQQRRLQLARRCIKAFLGVWPFDWKQQIARAAKTTSHWVTRHVRLGHLPGPSRRSQS
jgi:hypothetical protein